MPDRVSRSARPTEVRLFEVTDRSEIRDADPDPAALSGVSPGWRVLVGRDRRPIGVRLTLTRSGAAAPAMSELLNSVLAGFASESDGRPVFPHGLIVLSPRNFETDQPMSAWRAPRNVLLEVGQGDLDDERCRRQMFDIQKQGVRIALRLDHAAAVPSERLPYFQYLVASSRRAVAAAVDPANVSILTLDDSTHEQIDADFAAGVHATAGWPLQPVRRSEPRGLTPAQTAVFELIRLVQANADVRALEKVFRSEPVLAYLLLTLANSAALRRSTPVSSLKHAISVLGYQRLIKWLVLLLAIAGKEVGIAPLVYVAVVRGHLLENLLGAARRSRAECDEAFIIGTFSMLDAITGQPLSDLLRDVHLSEAITDALLESSGPHAALMPIARGFEAADPLTLVRIRAALAVDSGDANSALLHALAAADSLQSLIQ